MNKGKKDFNLMLNANKDMPGIKAITKEDQIKKYAGERMYFAPPIVYDNIMKEILFGKVITIEKIREYLTKENNADFTDPITAGIFVSIASCAGFQKSENETPYWRTLKVKGELNKKYPLGIQKQKELLENEGYTAIAKGRSNIRYCVNDFEKVLFDLNKK